MKRKLMTSALIIAMLAVLVAGASLAYFTDTDTADNTFTVGNVDISLIEQELGDKNVLQEFKQDKTLVPGKSDDGNAVSKIVTVENTGKNDAWVWVDLKIPTYLISKGYFVNSDETYNALHWNNYGYFTKEYYPQKKTTPENEGIIDANGKVTNEKMVAVEDGLWNNYKYVGKETIDGVEYTVIRTSMEKTLPAGKVSLPCLRQVYMDWRVITNEDGTQFILPDGDPISTKASWEVKVSAYAIQADGFDSVDKAIAAYTNNGK